MEPYNPHDEPLEVTDFQPHPVELFDQQGRYVPTQMEYQYRFKKRRRLAIILFFATCFSVFFAGMNPGDGGPFALLDPSVWKEVPAELWKLWFFNGLQYASSLMLILFAHEMGHYLQAKRYGVPASFPFFIPFPINPFGTMGAVIVQGAGVADRKSMFDIAISGPLAGLVFALPIAWWGMLNSSVQEVVVKDLLYDNPLILQWMAEAVHGTIPNGSIVTLNPLLFAGWVGVFITALNLIPIGQLDGGHILYTLIGKKAHYVAMGLMGGVVALMAIFSSWDYIVFVILLYFMGPKHPPTADDTVPLGTTRIILGWVTLAFIIIGFTPTPIILQEEEQKQEQKQMKTLPANEIVLTSYHKAIKQQHLLQQRQSSKQQAVLYSKSSSQQQRQ